MKCSTVYLCVVGYHYPVLPTSIATFTYEENTGFVVQLALCTTHSSRAFVCCMYPVAQQ